MAILSVDDCMERVGGGLGASGRSEVRGAGSERGGGRAGC